MEDIALNRITIHIWVMLPTPGNNSGVTAKQQQPVFAFPGVAHQQRHRQLRKSRATKYGVAIISPYKKSFVPRNSVSPANAASPLMTPNIFPQAQEQSISRNDRRKSLGTPISSYRAVKRERRRIATDISPPLGRFYSVYRRILSNAAEPSLTNKPK